MIVLGLLTCIMLRAFTAQAKVVDSFNECKEFFYEGIEPRGMDQNAKKICQKLKNKGFSYATLYSVNYRIPLYSAYTLDPACSSSHGRPKNWYLEPQISDYESTIDHMVRETLNNQNLYKGNQAISRDYNNSGYDRGHLNPSFFQCGDSRKATFTLTNTAPMNRYFNQIPWNKWESTLRAYLLDQLIKDSGSATAFIVTGTVPDPNVRIPRQGTSEESERVSVPSHIWTAVCYKHSSTDTKSFSFGYMGRNKQEEPDRGLISVSDLNDQLSRLYSELSGTNQSVEIFVDDCFSVNNKLVDLQGMFPDTCLGGETTLSNDSIPEENVQVKENTGKMVFDSMNTYYNVTEVLKLFTGRACLITNGKKIRDELRKRDASAGSDAVECLLVPEKPKTAADGSLCSRVTESGYSCQCHTGDKIKPCCSSPCLYQNKLKGYVCYSDQKLIECSPPYSLITFKGDRCLDDHPCAKYNTDFYWCFTGYFRYEWDYCSPPLWSSKAKNGQYCRSNHACAKYGEKQPWCYTDGKGTYDQCCTSDDCYSAVNYQTCRSDHPCGYHGKDYLWCYTDNKGNSNYCCTECSK